MEGIGSIIKFFAGLTVVVILAVLYWVVKWSGEEFVSRGAQHPTEVTKLMETAHLPDFEPGQKEFHRALELIAIGNLDEARERLSHIRSFHPESRHGPEARRILGEINLDELLSVENLSNKKRHVVRPGDSFVRIARQHDTTLANLMFLNGLLELGTLHPGDDLLVMPLHFHLVLDLARRRLELHDENGPVKEYPIRRVDLPATGSKPLSSKINHKVAEHRGRPYPPNHSQFPHGLKVLGFKLRGSQMQIRPVPRADEEEPGRGIFLDTADMEELSMLIRKGNEVEIRPAG